MIESREGLIDALEEASELEHGLMLQYLFAALSMKKRLDEGLTPVQQQAVRLWEGQTLSVAREEMAHLGTVCNLLSAVGGAPRFGRPNFPQPAHDYYPFSFLLTPFSDEAVYRFIRFELPKGEKPPDPPTIAGESELAPELATLAVPDPLEYEYVGELYKQIRAAFNRLSAETLFIGPRAAQDIEVWSRRMQILRVVDRASADAAIDFIITEGEGAPGKRTGSHYDTFLRIREDLARLQQESPGFVPARPVVRNPRTRAHRDAPLAGTLLEDQDTVRVAEVFNACYEAMLLMLAQLYSYGGETGSERAALRDGARQLMTTALRPMGELLMEMPAKNTPGGGAAGPTFELDGNLQLATQVSNRWTILRERLSDVVQAAAELGQLHPRFQLVAQTISLISQNVGQTHQMEERL